MLTCSERAAKRSGFLALGLLTIFSLLTALGDWESIKGFGDWASMKGLVLGLVIFFIVLLHIVLGLIDIVAAMRSGRSRPANRFYLHFGIFAAIAMGCVALVSQRAQLVDHRIEHVTEPKTATLHDTLSHFKTDPTTVALEPIRPHFRPGVSGRT